MIQMLLKLSWRGKWSVWVWHHGFCLPHARLFARGYFGFLQWRPVSVLFLFRVRCLPFLFCFCLCCASFCCSSVRTCFFLVGNFLSTICFQYLPSHPNSYKMPVTSCTLNQHCFIFVLTIDNFILYVKSFKYLHPVVTLKKCVYQYFTLSLQLIIIFLIN